MVLNFTEINISDHELGKGYFNMLAELSKCGLQCSASAPHLRQSLTEAQHRRKAVNQWRWRLRTRVCDKGQHFEQLLN